jgi:hypothetical protein
MHRMLGMIETLARLARAWLVMCKRIIPVAMEHKMWQGNKQLVFNTLDM